MEGRKPLADPAPSQNPSQSSDKASASSHVDSAAFANTKQHVADKQAGDGDVERFTNTKLNIALINDPKNGPRFTLTKRESGVSESDPDGKAPDAPDRDAPQPAQREDAVPEQKSTEPPASARSDTVPSHAPAPAPVDDRTADVGPAVEPAAPTPIFSAVPPPALPDGVPPAAEPPSKVPVDSSKTFIGPNGTYYDESWRWMDWRGTRQSWNWPAALSFGHWFAYRRLYRFAGLYLLVLIGVAAATVNNVPILALLALALLAVGLTGVYGNILYFRAFRRAVDHVTKTGEGSYQELQGQLARAGGTSVLAPGVMAILSIAGIAAAIVGTHIFRGGISVNLWPF